MTIDKQKFEEDGYLVVKNLFSEKEIDEFRANCYKQFEIDKAKGLSYNISRTNARSLRGDLLSKEMMRKIILDKRIISIAKQILGEDLVYFGDSNFQFGVGHRGFHRDNVDREYNAGPDWDGNYTIIRMAIYMQDHGNFSGGLKLKRGSHKNKTGKSVILETNIGDLAVWSLRTLHSGNAVRLKLFPKLPVDYFEKHVPSFMKKDEASERVACFFTFGINGKHLNRYISEYMLKAPPVLDNLKHSPLSAEVISQLAELKVELVKPIAEYGN